MQHLAINLVMKQVENSLRLKVFCFPITATSLFPTKWKPNLLYLDIMLFEWDIISTNKIFLFPFTFCTWSQTWKRLLSVKRCYGDKDPKYRSRELSLFHIFMLNLISFFSYQRTPFYVWQMLDLQSFLVDLAQEMLFYNIYQTPGIHTSLLSFIDFTFFLIHT